MTPKRSASGMQPIAARLLDVSNCHLSVHFGQLRRNADAGASSSADICTSHPSTPALKTF